MPVTFEFLDSFKSLSLCVALLPLVAALIAGLFGRQLGRLGVASFCILSIGFSCLLSLWMLKRVLLEEVGPLNLTLYTWGKISSLQFQVGFLVDRLSLLMISVVTFVSWMVHIYTMGYMRDDPGYQRFFCYISLFTFGMLMLVMSNNFLQLFFGWEMVGLMSYLLIGFWFQREKAIFANFKAFIVNRVGDFGFILGIAGVLYYFGTLDYSGVFSKVDIVAASEQRLPFFYFSISGLTFVCLCLFVGAMGKSAQVPLHVWLPDSMEGPTPISALIHAATMVTAGVFMLARLSPLFEYSETALNIILVIGSITCLLMGLVSVVQNDIKKIIAYSTLSQLGYMMTAIGVSAYQIGIFHLMTHAFFKALLFLGAGSVILALHHEQNIWKMGNLKKYMPITYVTMLIGSLALIGFPFFSGFYSKELIIEAVKFSHLSSAPYAYAIVLGGVFITTLYTFRLFFVVFHTKERMPKEIEAHLHESPSVIWIPLILLAIPSVIAGAWFIGPLFENYFQGSIVIHPNHESFITLKTEFTGALSMAIHGLGSAPFGLALAGIFIAWLSYVKVPNFAVFIKEKSGILYTVLQHKFGFDELYQWVFAAGAQRIGRIFWHVGDQWLIDGIGVNGTAHSVGRLSRHLRRLQTGYLYHYAFVMIAGFLVLIAWLIFTN